MGDSAEAGALHQSDGRSYTFRGSFDMRRRTSCKGKLVHTRTRNEAVGLDRQPVTMRFGSFM